MYLLHFWGWWRNIWRTLWLIKTLGLLSTCYKIRARGIYLYDSTQNAGLWNQFGKRTTINEPWGLSCAHMERSWRGNFLKFQSFWSSTCWTSQKVALHFNNDVNHENLLGLQPDLRSSYLDFEGACHPVTNLCWMEPCLVTLAGTAALNSWRRMWQNKTNGSPCFAEALEARGRPWRPKSDVVGF